MGIRSHLLIHTLYSRLTLSPCWGISSTVAMLGDLAEVLEFEDEGRHQVVHGPDRAGSFC